jgi:hypothetical protein
VEVSQVGRVEPGGTPDDKTFGPSPVPLALPQPATTMTSERTRAIRITLVQTPPVSAEFPLSHKPAACTEV